MSKIIVLAEVIFLGMNIRYVTDKVKQEVIQVITYEDMEMCKMNESK